MPGGLKRGGSSEVAPSTSTGSFTSDFSGSRIRASVFHALSQGPPPISTAAVATNMCGVTCATACAFRTLYILCTTQADYVTEDYANLTMSGHPAMAAHTARRCCQDARPGGAHCQRSCAHHRRKSVTTPWIRVQRQTQVSAIEYLSRQRGARPSSAVGARSGVPLLLHVASTAASYSSDLPATFHLHGLAGTLRTSMR